MKNGTFMVSLALHGVIAIGAFIYAARSSGPAPPSEDLVWIEMAAPPEKAPARAPEPVKPASPAPQAAAPRAASPPLHAAQRPAMPGAKAGHGSSGGGLGVLAGEGAGDDGFEMNPEPGDGTGNGAGAAPAPEPPPAPPPPKPPPPRPKEPPCEDTTTKPKPIAKPRSIEYSDAARADGKEGRLLLQLVVAEDGTVGRVDVLSGVHPALDAAAIAAVKTWRFEPAMRCGKAVGGVTYRVARKFELGD